MTATTEQLTAATLLSLFPAGIAAHYSTALPPHTELLPAEAAGTQDMIEKRRLEFTHGRHCAHQAMRKLGLPIEAILKGADRAPIWPTSVCGSISHSGTTAAAVIAHRRQLAGIGLDIETAGPLAPEIAEMICRPDELKMHDGEHAKLLFSIKEAVYKCIYPNINCYVDFQEMEIFLQENDGSFSAQSHSPNFDASLVDGLQGRYCSNAEFVISSAWILPKTNE
jgi:4'-phosphopantetheinyl transferase EntD